MTLNRYTYANNSPLNYWDPDGHLAQGATGPMIDGQFSVGCAQTGCHQGRTSTDAYVAAPRSPSTTSGAGRTDSTSGTAAADAAMINLARRYGVALNQGRAASQMQAYLDARGALPGGWNNASFRDQSNAFAWTILRNTSRTDLTHSQFRALPDAKWSTMWTTSGQAALEDIYRKECNWVCRNKSWLQPTLAFVAVTGAGFATGGAASMWAAGAGYSTTGAGFIGGGAGGLGASLTGQAITGDFSLNKTLIDTAIGSFTGYAASRLATPASATVSGSVSRVQHSPGFIAHPNGEVVVVPQGALGPNPVRTGKGVMFTGGSGGNGLHPRTTSIRIMDPVTAGKYQYPQGYVVYENAAGHTVHPSTGQPVSRFDPMAHWGWSS